MGDFDDDPAFRAFHDRRLFTDTRASSYGSVALLLVAGLYTCLKALEFLGYPVWLRLHMAVERAKAFALQEGAPAGAPSAHDDTEGQGAQVAGNMLSRAFEKGVRGVAGALSKGLSDAPPGLGNWDNSCYQNSVIQGMASLPSLRAYLAHATTQYSNLGIDSTNGALFDMVSKLNDPRNHGQNFWIKGKLKSMSTFQQQDAQEYYSKILDALEKEVQHEVKRRRPSNAWADAAKVAMKDQGDVSEDAASRGRSCHQEKKDQILPEHQRATPNPLDGLLAQRVGCVRCGYVEGLQLIPFNCITVSLGRNNVYDIRECLDDYTQLEQIEGVECAKCTLLKNKAALAPLAARAPAYAERLQAVESALDNDDFDDKTLIKKFKILKKNWTQSVKSRQAVIARAPKALVLHVNRSIFDEMNGAMYKNSAKVSYPKVLDLGNWCLGSDLAGGEWPRDPTKSMLGDANAEPITNSSYQYQLRAAVTHYGSHGNGHYVCYRPHARVPASERSTDSEDVEGGGEQWWRFSDDSVYAISEAQAHQGNIFMLFYERVEESDVTPADATDAAYSTIAFEDSIPLPPDHEVHVSQMLDDDTAAMTPLPADDGLLGDQPDTPSAEVLPILPGVHTRGDAPNDARTATPPKDEHRDSVSKYLPYSDAQFVAKTTKIGAQTIEDNKGQSREKSDAENDYPTPPPESPSATSFDDGGCSEAGSDFPPSTLLTSDDEADGSSSKMPTKTSPSPQLLRTAGDSPSRDEGNRSSLPMVTA